MSRLAIGIVIVIVILIIVGIGIGLYYAFGSSTESSESSPAQSTATEQPTSVTTTPATAMSATSATATSVAQAPINTAEQTAIDTALSDAYGFYSAASPPSNALYGIINTTGAHCRALGGAMNGTPGDNAWTDCHLQFGRDPARAPKGFLPAGSCPSGTCQYGNFSTTGRTCRALGGAMNGTPGDDEWTACHMNLGDQPKYKLYPSGKCPTGNCYTARFGSSTGAQCRALGGTALGEPWGKCEFNIGQASR